jgi:hypothetical protein
MRIKFETIESRLREIGKQAVLAAPKARQMAKVNSKDRFALFFSGEADSAMMEEVIEMLDEKGKRARVYTDWFFYACKPLHNSRHSRFGTLAWEAAELAYSELYGNTK